MKTTWTTLFLGISCLLSRGIMADQTNQPQAHKWLTVKDEETGVVADFPHQPLELSFDHPFQNTPSQGQVRIYSVPTQKGLLVVSTFHSSTLQSPEVNKELLQWFFEKVLVPHFFFNPTVYQDHQTFNYVPLKAYELQGGSFEISFLDHDVIKKLKGLAVIKDQTLYLPFYLAAEDGFDKQVFDQFLKSVKIP